jgi:predicted metal-dependent phosphoesterase TrpH/glycosyltransferase involved in cell wall biosynthesis
VALAYPGRVAESDTLSIVQVTPYSWGPRHEVNDFVGRVSGELAERGHRVLIAGPTADRGAVREGREAIRTARRDPGSVFGRGGSPRFVAVGSGVPLPRGPRPRPAPVPVDASPALEALLGAVPFDIVHVHEPFAPSVSSVALRHSFSLNVGSFHEPEERVLSTQVARPLVEIFFGRLDARTASSRATRELLERYFAGSYDLVLPGADPVRHEEERSGPLRILFAATEERGAMRTFLRALRRIPLELDWRVTIAVPEDDQPPIRVNRRLRQRIETVELPEGALPGLAARHDVVCAASGGSRPSPSTVRQALASGSVPVVSRLPVYTELVGDGELGLMFPPGDAETLAGQLCRLAEDRERLAVLRRAAATPAVGRSWSDVADELEDVYRRVVGRRHDGSGEPELRRRVSRRRLIEVDLHMHTDHSPDCATPVEVLLETAKDRGLDAIAITDHNEISGALAAREVAERDGGIKVIVAEEVKTAEQGEIIGLFVEEKIERGMTMAETIAEIRRQGGLVYVPHPFDRLHSVPDYEHLTEIVEEIDILEVFNPRVTLAAFNEEAERFARKYRIVPGAGSDSHVAQGLGSVRIRMHDFNGPAEFLEAMRDADITRRKKNMAYVQALKFLQTTGRPKAQRRSVPDAKPVKGGRPRTRRAGRRAASKS